MGPTRLMAFTLEGEAKMPETVTSYPPLPTQPALESTADTIASGKALYSKNCRGCHGDEAIARFGGSVPDLRYATADTHATWQAIVVGGLKSSTGMPAMDIEVDDSEAIRNYILSLSEEIRSGK